MRTGRGDLTAVHVHWRHELLLQVVGVTRRCERTLERRELTAAASGGGHQMTTVVPCALQCELQSIAPMARSTAHAARGSLTQHLHLFTSPLHRAPRVVRLRKV